VKWGSIIKLRVLLGALVLGLTLLGVAGASAQTDDSASVPQVTNPSSDEQAPAPVEPTATDSAEQDSEDIAPVEVVQPKPKPVVEKPKPKPKPVAARPAPKPPVPPPQPRRQQAVPAAPVIAPDFAAQIAPVGAETQGSVMSATTAVPISPVQGASIPACASSRSGDNVNWDFLPEVAIDNLAVVSNNPVFGLNALGGAIVVNMKSGFTYQGAEVSFDAGSFGRVEGSAQVGMKSGNWGVYFGGERIEDDGYRDFSPATVKRCSPISATRTAR
jgi:iron complex outermembrane receptor protein